MRLVLGSLVTTIAWILPGTLGGFLLALEINRHGLKIGGRGLAWIALGWGLGFGLGAGVARAVENLVSPVMLRSSAALRLVTETAPWTTFGITTGLIAGAIGDWVMYKVISGASPAPL